MPAIQAPLFGLDVPAPYQGDNPTARASSATGAVYALTGRRGKTATYCQILKNHGPISDQEVAGLTKWSLSSVNSIRGTLLKLAREQGKEPPIVAEGIDVQTWDDGRTTQRTKWRLR